MIVVVETLRAFEQETNRKMVLSDVHKLPMNRPTFELCCLHLRHVTSLAFFGRRIRTGLLRGRWFRSQYERKESASNSNRAP